MANDAGAGSAINLEVELLGSLQKEHQHCLRVAKCQNGVIGVYLVRPLQVTIGLQWCFHSLMFDLQVRCKALHHVVLLCTSLYTMQGAHLYHVWERLCILYYL